MMLRYRIPYRLFSTTRKINLFNLSLEQDIRQKIDSLPKLDNIFYNSDGTIRKPNDDELKIIANLNALSETRSLSLKDFFTLSKENEDLYKDNDSDLKKFQFSSNKIIDKIPFMDPKTGDVRWKVIRENDKEGWEGLSYYLYVPLLIMTMGILIYRNDDNMDTWADKELMLRLRENAGSDTELIDALDKLIPELELKLTRTEKNQRDAVIIERILNGQYDNLMGLKLKKQEMLSK